MTSEEDLNRMRQYNLGDIKRKSIPGRRNSKFKALRWDYVGHAQGTWSRSQESKRESRKQ